MLHRHDKVNKVNIYKDKKTLNYVIKVHLRVKFLFNTTVHMSCSKLFTLILAVSILFYSVLILFDLNN